MSDKGEQSKPVRPARSSRSARVGAALFALACLAVLVLAAWLEPSPEGHGTHTRMGMSPCTWVVLFDRPCPTCGMTTAFAHAARGDVARSFLAQPLGMVLAFATAGAFWIASHVAVTGSTIHRIGGAVGGRRLSWLLVGSLLAAWVFKLATWTGG